MVAGGSRFEQLHVRREGRWFLGGVALTTSHRKEDVDVNGDVGVDVDVFLNLDNPGVRSWLTYSLDRIVASKSRNRSTGQTKSVGVKNKP